jgi:hypothetical protein
LKISEASALSAVASFDVTPRYTKKSRQAALHSKKLIRENARKKRHDCADIRIELPRI